MTKGYYEKCKNCGKDYYYESTGNIWPGGKDHETATCPYSKADGPSEFISGLFTHSSWTRLGNRFDNPLMCSAY